MQILIVEDELKSAEFIRKGLASKYQLAAMKVRSLSAPSVNIYRTTKSYLYPSDPLI